MTQTHKMIKKSKKEIEVYVTDILASSTDNIDVKREKIEIHKNVISSLRDINIEDWNESYYEEIDTIMDGIRKVKGLTPLGLISEKINILIEHIIFLRELRSSY